MLTTIRVNALCAMICLTGLAGGGLYVSMAILDHLLAAGGDLTEQMIFAIFAFPTACAGAVIYCAKTFAGGADNGKEKA